MPVKVLFVNNSLVVLYVPILFFPYRPGKANYFLHDHHLTYPLFCLGGGMRDVANFPNLRGYGSFPLRSRSSFLPEVSKVSYVPESP